MSIIYLFSMISFMTSSFTDSGVSKFDKFFSSTSFFSKETGGCSSWFSSLNVSSKFLSPSPVSLYSLRRSSILSISVPFSSAFSTLTSWSTSYSEMTPVSSVLLVVKFSVGVYGLSSVSVSNCWYPWSICIVSTLYMSSYSTRTLLFRISSSS